MLLTAAALHPVQKDLPGDRYSELDEQFVIWVDNVRPRGPWITISVESCFIVFWGVVVTMNKINIGIYL